MNDEARKQQLQENERHAAWEQGFRVGYRSGYADGAREPIQREVNPYTRTTVVDR